MRTHCRPATWAPKSLPIDGSATLTTVASSIAMPDPSTVATRIHRPGAEPYVTVDTIGA